MHAMYLMVLALGVLALGYRYYSAFLAARVAMLDDLRTTPAYSLNDGQNYHPTNKWVLFGHHFAAISGAGPLIGPVLAAQFGYLPGLLWILAGVILGGAVQDFLVLALSIRRQGRSLAQIAYDEIGPAAGTAATIGILFVIVVALAGLGKVVVNALGGETVTYPVGTRFVAPGNAALEKTPKGYRIPAQALVHYPQSASVLNVEAFELSVSGDSGAKAELILTTPAQRLIPGSSWGAFTIACTIPIALFIGWYMYYFRKGRVLEASIIGGLLTLLATYLGAFLNDPQSCLYPWKETFNLTSHQVCLAMAVYGFLASVLPVWVLLCPRDYLSSFLKIGTIGLLVFAVMIANPILHAPAINHLFLHGGPIVKGPAFPFVFITIMCGAISGFHALVASGTTPKMIQRESQARMIGYGAMLTEGLVGIVALIAAAALPMNEYYAMNTSWADVPVFHDKFQQLFGADLCGHSLTAMEHQVGENLHGRASGAVTLAVGMARVLDGAARNLLGHSSHMLARLDALIPYWFHFAIMFEALFILTTIDTGTRIGRFLVQETMGKIRPSWGRPDWIPGSLLATALTVGGWYYFIQGNSMDTIWPMFGVANQLLAVIALAVVSVWIARRPEVKRRYLAVSLVPMGFVGVTTLTAAWQLLAARWSLIAHQGLGTAAGWNALVSGSLMLAILACMGVILWGAMRRICSAGVCREVV